MSDQLVSLYYKIVSSNTSRKIIVLLGEGKCSRATELIKELKVSPGTFYDALKRLEGIVDKTEDGRYELTQTGRKIYYMLLDESKGFHSSPSFLLNAFTSLPFLFPVQLIRYISSQRPYFILSFAATILIFGMVATSLSKLIPVVLVMLPPYVAFSSSLNISFIGGSLKFSLVSFPLFLINAIFVLALAYFLTNVFGNLDDALKFSLILFSIFIPNIAFSLIYFAFQQFFSTLPFMHFFLISLIPLFFVFTLLTTCIFNFASLRIEAAFMISLILLFLSLVSSELLLQVLI